MAYEIASLAISLGIGLGQIGILWIGIRAMNRSSDERAAARAEAARANDQRHAEAARANDQRHAEAMRALETLIARTAPAAD